MITRETTIEELVQNHPKSVRFLMEKGIKCLACGEPVWGTIESEAQSKGFSNDEITKMVDELTEYVRDIK